MTTIPIYDLSLSLRVGWEAHSISNAGSNGTNRLLGRKILLTNGIEADAASGNILKRDHREISREYAPSFGAFLCAGCSAGDAGGVASLPASERSQGHSIELCAVCDIHGYMIPGRSGDANNEVEPFENMASIEPSHEGDPNRGRGKRKRENGVERDKHTVNNEQSKQSRSSLIEFSFAISDPTCQSETCQLFTRTGDGRDGGQMLMTMPNRSGIYAMHVRYRAVGIGADTYTWRMIVQDPAQRLARHRAALSALRDQVLSPGGARTASMLPHLTSLTGAICVRHTVGRAPFYSGLDPRFVERLQALKIADLSVSPFDGIEVFSEVMERLIVDSVPAEIPMRTVR